MESQSRRKETESKVRTEIAKGEQHAIDGGEKKRGHWHTVFIVAAAVDIIVILIVILIIIIIIRRRRCHVQHP